MLLHQVTHAFLHALEHSLPLLPFLYITYLVIELLERKAGDKMQKALVRSGRFGPIFGSFLGVIPQCGFSAVGATLYAGRFITVGTLISIFLSTSDEMLPIMISNGTPIGVIVKILAYKVLVALVAGFLIDAIFSFLNKKRNSEEHRIHVEQCGKGHCHCEERNIWIAALLHMAEVALSILIITFALNLALEFLGDDFLSGILRGSPLLGVLLSAIVGLLPNCASSVVITQLYLDGILSAGAMLSGLLVGAGVGVLVLLRVNRPIKDSIKVILLLFFVGVVAGYLFELFGFVY